MLIVSSVSFAGTGIVKYEADEMGLGKVRLFVLPLRFNIHPC